MGRSGHGSDSSFGIGDGLADDGYDGDTESGSYAEFDRKIKEKNGRYHKNFADKVRRHREMSAHKVKIREDKGLFCFSDRHWKLVYSGGDVVILVPTTEKVSTQKKLIAPIAMSTPTRPTTGPKSIEMLRSTFESVIVPKINIQKLEKVAEEDLKKGVSGKD